jgi:hypothetical protein
MEQPPQAQAPAPSPQPKSEGGSPSAIAQSVFSGLMKLTDMAEQAGLPPEIVQELGAVAQAFEAVMDKLAGGAKPQQPAQPSGPTAGGPGAVPV